MVEFKNCTIGYPNKMIFERLNLAFKAQTVTAILGLNGCGKTTLLSSVFASRKLISGDITVAGQSVKALSQKKLAAMISVVPQIQHIAFDFLVRDVVLMGRNPHIGFSPKKDDYVKADETLSKLNIGYLGDKSYARISGGERQMVNIARAVAQDTPVILMDEPTSFLDLKNQARVMKLISRLNKEDGKAIIMTLHDPSQAFDFSEEVVFVENGKTLSGRSKELIEPEMIQRIYGVPSEIINIRGKTRLVPLSGEESSP